MNAQKVHVPFPRQHDCRIFESRECRIDKDEL